MSDNEHGYYVKAFKNVGTVSIGWKNGGTNDVHVTMSKKNAKAVAEALVNAIEWMSPSEDTKTWGDL